MWLRPGAVLFISLHCPLPRAEGEIWAFPEGGDLAGGLRSIYTACIFQTDEGTLLLFAASSSLKTLFKKKKKTTGVANCIHTVGRCQDYRSKVTVPVFCVCQFLLEVPHAKYFDFLPVSHEPI